MQTETSEEYQALYKQYMYVYGVLAIMVEQEGGVVEIPRNLLEEYDLTTTMTISHSAESDVYVIEVVPSA